MSVQSRHRNPASHTQLFGPTVIESLERRTLLTTVAFFDDPGYVNTASGSDSNSLLQELQSTGDTVKTFAGIDAASFTTGLTGANVLVIPALDQADLGAALSASSIGVIDQFVSSGGGLIITADASNNFANFLNQAFGYDVAAGGPGAPFHLSSAASESDFASSPASLPGNTNSNGLVITSLPSGSEDFYDAYYNVNATGVLMPYGSRESVCFLGWDWTNGGPDGSQDGGWNSVLGTALTQVAGNASLAAPQASVTGLGASALSLEVGQSFDFAIDVLPATGSGPTPTGSATFYEGGVNKGTYDLTDGKLTESFTVDTVGNSVFDAVYSGDANYASSTSNNVAQTYFPASTATETTSRVTLPKAAISGQIFKSKTSVTFKNTGAKLRGNFLEQLYLDTDAVGLSENPYLVAHNLVEKTLATGKTLAASFSTQVLPASITAGTYYVVAKITDPLGNVDLVNLSNKVSVAVPVVEIAASVGSVKPATVATGKTGSVVVTITNNGNISATSQLTITLAPSLDGSTPVANEILATHITLRATLKPSKPMHLTIRLKVPATLAAGFYSTIATISFDSQTAKAIGSPFTAG